MAGQYFGVGGVARKVKNQYIGVASVARKIKYGFIGVGGVARKFFASAASFNVYNGGTWSGDVTGVTLTAGKANGLSLYPYRTKQNNGSFVYTDAIIRLNSKIDLSDYKSITVTFSYEGYLSGAQPEIITKVGVSTNSNVTNASNLNAVGSANGTTGIYTHTCKADISSITGEQYIYISCRGVYLIAHTEDHPIKITKIYLEADS